MGTNTLIGILIFIIIFLVCRELMCWYWKLNRIVVLLEEISAKLSLRERA